MTDPEYRKIVAEVSVDADSFPWHAVADRRYYSDYLEPMKMLVGMPKKYGLNPQTNTVDFVFYEGCDLKTVMLFKLQWGGK